MAADMDLLQSIAAGGGAVAALAGGAALVRRRLSRDSTEMVKDRAESDVVARLERMVEAANTQAAGATAQATADREHRIANAQMIARLSAENDYLRRDLERVSAERDESRSHLDTLTGGVRRMVRDLPPAAQREVATDFATLGPVEESPLP